jgi:hypothetical protein
MGDPSDSGGAFGFGKFVPGFDFLQNLAKGATQAMPQMPGTSSWVAPTLNVAELDKRISELKAVQFWLEQNGKALAATIQALEVQKMTLATLEGMNVQMGEVAEAFKLKPEAWAAGGKAADQPAQKKGKTRAQAGGGAAPVDPLQWWGALTQQFQDIAANAMKDMAPPAAAGAQGGAGAAPAAASKAPAGKAARKAPARKPKAR